jgi:hypothetical protein
MLIWSGFGFLVPLYIVFSFIAVFFSVSSTFGDAYLSTHRWPLMLVFGLACVASWLTGTLLHRRPTKVFVDKSTGKEVTFKSSHSFFFIPMRWWGIPLFLIMIYLMFAPM